MKKNIFSKFSLFVLLMSFLNSGCTHESEITSCETSKSYLSKTYSDIMALPSIPILGNDGSEGYTTRSEDPAYPTVNSYNAKYLLGLSQSELEHVKDSLVNVAGGIQVLDNIQAANFMSVYNKIGGKEGINALIDFSVQYLNMEPGWDTLAQIIPVNILNGPAGQQYVEQAAYLDRVARPICELMISSRWEKDIPFCKMQLMRDLGYAGVSISTDAFLDAMSGGVETPELILQLISAGVNVYEAYYDYEACNGRWH